MPSSLVPSSSRKAASHDERAARAQEQEYKRARGAISCAECRRLKLKCDKTVPCSSCRRRGCASICPNGSLTTGQGTRFILADTDRLHRKIGEMSDRIRQLEDALALLQSSVVREPHPLLAQDLLGIKSSLELHSAAARRNGQEASASGGATRGEDGEETEESQYIDAFGTLAVRDDGAATFYGRSAGSESLLLEETPKPAPVFLRPASYARTSSTRTILPPALARLSTSFPSAPSVFAEDEAVGEMGMQELIEEYLPPWPRAGQLAELYLSQAPWFFGAVAKRQVEEEVLPLFYEEARKLLAGAGAAEDDGDGDAKPGAGGGVAVSAAAFNLVSRAPEKEHATAHDLALLFVIFCFGALTDPELPPAPHNVEAERYFQLTRAALNIEPVLERPPAVVTVQTLSLMGIYQGLVADENSIESTWALMGLSSKLAQSIGLHRDCLRWKLSLAEVQKRRALFWEIFITDCWQALATGRLPTFDLPFVDTELPQDIDETLADDGSPQESFPHWKARWGKECVSGVVQGTLTSRAPKYTVILELDRKLRDMPLPKYAQGPPPHGAGLSETMSHFMPINYLHLTLLYVHRCFFAQALTDFPTEPLRSQYAPSFLAGYRSACALLNSVREQFELFPVQIARFWVLWTHGFSSAVMLASVVTHGGATKTAQAALGELRMAADLFERAATHGGRAVKFLPIIRRLHEKAYNTFTQGLPPTRDIFTARRDDDKNDELLIFSGRTRTVATKSNKSVPSSRARSVSRRRGNASTGTPPSATSTTTPASPESDGTSPSAHGSDRASGSPADTSFPALESYGSAVHPMLVDQMRTFQGELDEQIREMSAYWTSHHQQQQQVAQQGGPPEEAMDYEQQQQRLMPPPPPPVHQYHQPQPQPPQQVISYSQPPNQPPPHAPQYQDTSQNLFSYGVSSQGYDTPPQDGASASQYSEWYAAAPAPPDPVPARSDMHAMPPPPPPSATHIHQPQVQHQQPMAQHHPVDPNHLHTGNHAYSMYSDQPNAHDAAGQYPPHGYGISPPGTAYGVGQPGAGHGGVVQDYAGYQQQPHHLHQHQHMRQQSVDQPQAWQVPVENNLQYPVPPVEYHQSQAQPVHHHQPVHAQYQPPSHPPPAVAGAHYSNRPTPSHSRSQSLVRGQQPHYAGQPPPQQYQQQQMAMPPPGQGMLPLQPGSSYSLTETWTSFMQHELPTPQQHGPR